MTENVENLQSLWETFANRYLQWLRLDLPRLNVIDVLEIIIISFLIYKLLVFVKNTRAWSLLKGIIVIVVFWLAAALFQMNTILWIIARAFNVAVIALIVIFQPELRRALESIGRKNLLSGFFNFDTQKKQERFSDRTLADIVKASYEMGRVKTGALIAIEQNIPLTEYERTGIELDSVLSSQLLINIFEHNTPLHDGAVIVRGDRIVSATCYLPLSDNMELSKDLGTRHRAAVGLSEATDALVVVVSEETGMVSVAIGGKLFRNIDAENLKRKLGFVQNKEIDTDRFRLWKRRSKND